MFRGGAIVDPREMLYTKRINSYNIIIVWLEERDKTPVVFDGSAYPLITLLLYGLPLLRCFRHNLYTHKSTRERRKKRRKKENIFFFFFESCLASCKGQGGLNTKDQLSVYVARYLCTSFRCYTCIYIIYKHIIIQCARTSTVYRIHSRANKFGLLK